MYTVLNSYDIYFVGNMLIEIKLNLFIKLFISASISVKKIIFKQYLKYLNTIKNYITNNE